MLKQIYQIILKAFRLTVRRFYGNTSCIVATFSIFLKHFRSCSSHIFRCVLVTTTWIVLLTSHHSFSLTLTFKIKCLSKNDYIKNSEFSFYCTITFVKLVYKRTQKNNCGRKTNLKNTSFLRLNYWIWISFVTLLLTLLLKEHFKWTTGTWQHAKTIMKIKHWNTLNHPKGYTISP